MGFIFGLIGLAGIFIGLVNAVVDEEVKPYSASAFCLGLALLLLPALGVEKVVTQKTITTTEFEVSSGRKVSFTEPMNVAYETRTAGWWTYVYVFSYGEVYNVVVSPYVKE